MSDRLDLGGRIACVTGAGQGVGRAIALTLAEAGAGGVVVNDFDPGRAAAVAAEVEALGVRAHAAVVDVGDHAAVAAAFAAAEAALGPVTLLVNNAGNAGPEAPMRSSPLFWETDPGEWHRYFHTNLHGVMNCCHVAVPGMIRAGRGGRIVTIVSDAGRIGEARLAAYSAAKAGAAGFVRALARETGRHAITCNAISLSTIEPPLEGEAREAFLASEQAKAITARYAIRRMGRPHDVAGMALFLCSDAAEWITGQTIPVNGGYSFAQ